MSGKNKNSERRNIGIAVGVTTAFGVFGAIISYMQGKQAATQEHNEEIQKMAAERCREAMSSLENAPLREYKEENEITRCKICYTYEANIVFMPCRHTCACSKCSKQLAKNSSTFKCSVCRTSIESMTVVYPQ